MYVCVCLLMQGQSEDVCMHVCLPSIYIYICAVELKTGPRFGGSSVKTGPSLVLKLVQVFLSLLSHFYSIFCFFENTNSVTLCQNSVFAKFGGCQK